MTKFSHWAYRPMLKMSVLKGHLKVVNSILAPFFVKEKEEEINKIKIFSNAQGK